MRLRATVLKTLVRCVYVGLAIAYAALAYAPDPFSRRYLVTYSSSGETWIQMLDLWGTAIGSPVSLTPGANGVQPRIASGGGRFVVVYTDTTAGIRVARFVQTGVSSPTVGSAI